MLRLAGRGCGEGVRLPDNDYGLLGPASPEPSVLQNTRFIFMHFLADLASKLLDL